MAYIVYNLTHLIPKSCTKSNLGIMLMEDGRTLSAGKHRIINTISEFTKKYAKKRIIHNEVEYEILRIIETKDSEITSPGDRKKLEEILNQQQEEMHKKFTEKTNVEKRISEANEARKLAVRHQEYLDTQKQGTFENSFETFKKNAGNFKIDGKPTQPQLKTEEILVEESVEDKQAKESAESALIAIEQARKQQEEIEIRARIKVKEEAEAKRAMELKIKQDNERVARELDIKRAAELRAKQETERLEKLARENQKKADEAKKKIEEDAKIKTEQDSKTKEIEIANQQAAQVVIPEKIELAPIEEPVITHKKVKRGRKSKKSQTTEEVNA